MSRRPRERAAPEEGSSGSPPGDASLAAATAAAAVADAASAAGRAAIGPLLVRTVRSLAEELDLPALEVRGRVARDRAFACSWMRFLGETRPRLTTLPSGVVVRPSDHRDLQRAEKEGRLRATRLLAVEGGRLVGVVVAWTTNSLPDEARSVLAGAAQLLATELVGGLEMDNAGRFREIAMARMRELHSLSAKMITAQDEERARVARDLHDEVGQRLAAMSLLLDQVRGAEPGPEWRPSLDKLRRELQDVAGEVRRIARGLHPSALEYLGLKAALEMLVDGARRLPGIEVTLLTPAALPALPDHVQTCLYRVVQEALTNVLRHAGARKVRVELGVLPRGVRLQVADDGRGFSPTVGRGLGIAGMRERVVGVGGRFTVLSRPGKGTAIYVWIPLEETR